jgi:hypothetical protein
LTKKLGAEETKKPLWEETIKSLLEKPPKNNFGCGGRKNYTKENGLYEKSM